MRLFRFLDRLPPPTPMTPAVDVIGVVWDPTSPPRPERERRRPLSLLGTPLGTADWGRFFSGSTIPANSSSSSSSSSSGRAGLASADAWFTLGLDVRGMDRGRDDDCGRGAMSSSSLESSKRLRNRVLGASSSSLESPKRLDPFDPMPPSLDPRPPLPDEEPLPKLAMRDAVLGRSCAGGPRRVWRNPEPPPAGGEGRPNPPVGERERSENLLDGGVRAAGSLPAGDDCLIVLRKPKPAPCPSGERLKLLSLLPEPRRRRGFGMKLDFVPSDACREWP